MATPTLVQHVSTGMDNTPVGTFAINLPNPGGAGNLLILGIQCASAGSITSVTDNKGSNTWVAGPTVTNATSNRKLFLYYALNITSATQLVTVTFSGLTTNTSGAGTGYPQCVLSEWYNIATSSAVDGTAVGSSTSKTAGSITTTANGDLVYQWGVDISDTTTGAGPSFNGTSITKGSGFTLITSDLQIGLIEQYQIQSTAGAISPAFTTSGAAVWGSLAIAFKSASAGTAPGGGVRVVGVMHTSFCGNVNTVTNAISTLAFPTLGNLIVGAYQGEFGFINSVTDSKSNSWSFPGTAQIDQSTQVSQIIYAGNATASTDLNTIAFGWSTTPNYAFIILFDIIGAATSPFDNATTVGGDQTTNGSFTCATITPTTANGIVLYMACVQWNTCNGFTVSGNTAISDIVVNSLDDNNQSPGPGWTVPSSLEEDCGVGHVYNAGTSSMTFVTQQLQTASTGAQAGPGVFSSAAAAFKAGPSAVLPTAKSTSVGSSVVPFHSVDRALVTRF